MYSTFLRFFHIHDLPFARFSGTSNCCTSSKHLGAQKLSNEEDVEANGSCIKSHDTASLHVPNHITSNNNLRKHKGLDAGLDSDQLPLLLPVKVESMLTGRSMQKTRPNTISSFAFSGSPADEWPRSASLARSNSFTITGRPFKYQRTDSFPGDPSDFVQSSTPSIPPSIVVEGADHNDDVVTSDEERSRAGSAVEYCLSKYLDSTPKQHEVYSSIFGNRPKSSRRRSVTKRLPDNIKRSGSVHIQRQASMLILAERRKSMTMQIAGFGETFAYFNEICNDRRALPRAHAALGVKKKVEARKQRISDGSSRVSACSVDLLKAPDVNTSEEGTFMRRPRLHSQNAIDMNDDYNGIDKEDASNRYSNNSDTNSHVSSVRYSAEHSTVKKLSKETRHDDYGHEVVTIPRKFPSLMAEPVKVSALKISRRKLMPLREGPVNFPKYSDKSETESRSSICRTPLGSIDEVEENDYFDSQREPTRVPGILKSSIKQIQPFGEDRSEVADWLRKNSNMLDMSSEQSDSDSTAKGSVVSIRGEKCVGVSDASKSAEKFMPVGYNEDYDTDDEVSAAFDVNEKTNSIKVIKDPPKVGLDGAILNDHAIHFSDEPGHLKKPKILESSSDVLTDKFGHLSAGIAAKTSNPKTFSNAMYMIANANNDSVSKVGKISSLSPNPIYRSSKDSWKARSSEEFPTEHDALLVSQSSSSRPSKRTSIRRSSSCEFEFDPSESTNDIAKIRSLRRKSKKQKMETKTDQKATEKTKLVASNTTNETEM